MTDDKEEKTLEGQVIKLILKNFKKGENKHLKYETPSLQLFVFLVR
jgi:hypothetical protein